MEPKIQEKVWEPKIESEIRKTWDESGIYDFTIKDSNPCGSAARGYQTYNSQGGPLYSLSSNSTEVYLYTNTGSAIEAAGLGTTTLTGTFIYMTDS